MLSPGSTVDSASRPQGRRVGGLGTRLRSEVPDPVKLGIPPSQLTHR